jgi:hypothetical protein
MKTKIFRCLKLSACALVLIGTRSLFAFPGDYDPAKQNVQTGQLFEVKIIPGNKLVEVYVVGREMADVKFSDVNLVASVELGKRHWLVVPSRIKSHFVLPAPAEVPESAVSNLKLKVQYHDNSEVFNFRVSPNQH